MTLSAKDKIQLGVIGAAVLLSLAYLVQMGLSRRHTDLAVPASLTESAPGNGTAGEASLAQMLSSAPADAFRGKNAQANIRKEQENKAGQPWGRDPFFALSLEDKSSQSEPAVQAGGLALSGVSLRGSQAVAIVNHTIVHEGDEIFGMRVASIRKDSVTFTQNGDEFVLHFGGPQ